MSEKVAIDTTFAGISPQRLWIGVTNKEGDGKLHVMVEINGIKKSIWSCKPSYAEPEEGMINDYTDFTWVLSKVKP